MRKFPEDKIFHICNKSIANYQILKDFNNALRFIQTLDYYNSMSTEKPSLSLFLKKNKNYYPKLISIKPNSIIKFLSFCIMPDHYHILIKIIKGASFLKYINDVENSYTRFFNEKFRRKGPLWQNSFRSVVIKNNEQLLHVTRYIHLNPTTNNLIKKPEDWIFSSYKDYLNKNILQNYLTEISINNPKTYKNFVENRIDYQKKLKLIKKLILE